MLGVDRFDSLGPRWRKYTLTTTRRPIAVVHVYGHGRVGSHAG